MRRRDKASGKATKAQRHKAVAVKRRKTAVRRRNSHAASKKPNIAQVARESQLERQLRVNEERWRAVIANPFIGITVLDRNQFFIVANSTYQKMVGYTNYELNKLTPLDITPAAEREINKVLFKELQEGKRQHFELVKRLQRKDAN